MKNAKSSLDCLSIFRIFHPHCFCCRDQSDSEIDGVILSWRQIKMNHFRKLSTFGIFIALCGCFSQSVVSADLLSLPECSADKLIIYKLVLHTFWTSSRFPKHYPQWRPPAQWSKLIGRWFIKHFLFKIILNMCRFDNISLNFNYVGILWALQAVVRIAIFYNFNSKYAFRITEYALFFEQTGNQHPPIHYLTYSLQFQELIDRFIEEINSKYWIKVD